MYKSSADNTLPKARVFISCGQRCEKEKTFGFVCRDYFANRGFHTYLAEEVQNLEALTDNIFRHLKNSEYGVFIDCKREQLEMGKFRGSLFVNQELAIAAFLQIDSRVFHETGVERNGVVEYLVAKPIQFCDQQEFLNKLDTETKLWQNGWRNELSLNFLECVPNVMTVETRKLTDWYQLQVRNNHYAKYARNCVAYVTEITNIDTDAKIDTGNFELTWSGTGLFERHVLPNRAVEIDAFLIYHDEEVIRFQHRASTSTQYQMPALKKGNYILTYLVVSENFESLKKTFRLEFDGNHTNIKFIETAPTEKS